MYVTSKAGTEILKSQYEIIDSINGIPTLETDYSQLKHNHTEPMLMLSPAFNDKYIMVLKEQESVTESSRLRLTGVHSFIYDFSLDRIYEEYTQYFSLENILNLVFKGSEYAFEVSGSTRYNALAFENFGDNDKMSLINQICDRWELEYRVKDNKVYFADQRGSKTTKQFRYKMNIHDSHVNLDISEGATYIRAYFGKKDEENPSNSTYVEKEMLHPLAKDFGVRHAKPYSNEVITQEETMQRYMKMKIEETWKLSVEIDVLDLFGDGSAEVGDEVWAIDERMDLKYKTRIVEKRDYYDVNDRIYRTKVVLGNKTFIEAVSAQEVTAEDLEYEVRRYTNKRIEQLKAEKDNDFNAIRDTLRSEFSDALAQSKIEVAADFDRMEKLLDTKSADWTEDFNQSVAESKEYAEQQAQEKASAVQSNLDSFKDSHQQLYDEVTGNILDIDTFLGDKSKTLKQQFDKIRTDFGTLQTDLDGVESDLTATKTDLQKQLDAARGDLDGLEVGGRNLLIGSNDDWIEDYLSPNQYYRNFFHKETILESGQKYTFSVEIERTSELPKTLRLTFGSGTITYQYDFSSGNIPSYDAKGQRVYTTFTPTERELRDHKSFAWRIRNDLKEISYRYRRPMLTKGNVKLDYQPAPEDTEEKITRLNQQIEFLDGQLSAKLEQTDLLPINNKITEYGNSLTANAQSIESLISKTELHDGDITKWSNQATANAENITSALSRISNTESGLTKAQTDIIANADGLSAVVNRVNKTETGIESLTTDFNIEAGKVETLITKTDGHASQLTNIVADYEKIEQTVAKNDAWLGTYGSAAEQTIAGFEQKVWMSDVANINPNLIPFADTSNLDTVNRWQPWISGEVWVDSLGELNVSRTSSGTAIGVQSYPFELVQGRSYTLSVIIRTSVSWNSQPGSRYTYLIRDSGANTNLGTPNKSESLDPTRQKNIWTFVADKTENVRVLIGTQKINPDAYARLSFKEPKMEEGAEATLFMNAFSNIEQKANELSLKVQELTSTEDGGFLTQSDITVQADRVKIGSVSIGPTDMASIISVSPSAIDLISDKINVTGNVNIKGGVTSLAVEAIEGNFARLFANQLTANVVKSTHIEASTTLVDKLFATSARVDQLITKTHFVNEMHALTLNVVDLNASQIRAKLLSANTIEASWIKSGTALLDRVFSSTAMFERMMTKSGFVTTLNTVTIDTDQITIRRPDGGALISQGMQMFGSPIITKPFPSQNVEYDFVNYTTNMSGAQTFERAYAEHSGRWANFSFSVSLRYDSQHASSLVGIAIRLGTSPSGVYIPPLHTEEVMAYRDSGSRSYTVNVRLPVPTYGGLSWTLEFYRIGGVSGNYVQIRSNRCWVSS